MKNLKPRTLWIILAILLVLLLSFIAICPFTDGALNTCMLVLIGVDLVLITILIQYASAKTFKFKAKNNYIKKEYIGPNNIIDTLNNLGFKERKREYGLSYLKINGDVAYKVTLVNDIDIYFTPVENEENNQSDSNLKNCKTFIGLEIFTDCNEKHIHKIPDFSIQGNNVFYTALIKTDEVYTSLNYIEPIDIHKDNYLDLLNDLGINIKEEE